MSLGVGSRAKIRSDSGILAKRVTKCRRASCGKAVSPHMYNQVLYDSFSASFYISVLPNFMST